MKFSYLKIIAVFLILSVLSISIPNYVNAGFVPFIVWYAMATVVTAAVVYDYVSCNFNVLWGGCGDGGGGGSAPEPKLNSQTAVPIMNTDGTCTTGITLNYQTVDALKYRIYRDEKKIADGFLGDERKTRCETDEYGQPPSDCDIVEEQPIGYDDYGQPYYESVYDGDGNYIGQRGKKTYYKKEYWSYPSPHTSNFSYTDTNIEPNRDYKYDIILLDRNGKEFRFDTMNAYSECIKLDLKINGYDNPQTYIMPNSNPDINWETMAAISCAASGDWSGNKGPESGREDLGYLKRGTSNPGQGKTYNYTLTCQYPKNKTLTDTVSATVFRKPNCEFSADPSVIEILPAVSTLSWDCLYYKPALTEYNSSADSCSINNGVGSVDPGKGEKEVRPSQETTYTLTCSAIDGSKEYQSSIKVGFAPRIREIIPR